MGPALRDFWRLDKTTQAELIWTALFVQHSPLSEACRGVLTTLHALGLDVKAAGFAEVAAVVRQPHLEGHLLRVMDLAGVRTICMTNSPFDDAERAVWDRGRPHDNRFTSALRIDPLLLDWPAVGSASSAGLGLRRDAGADRNAPSTACGGSSPIGTGE